MMIELNSYKYLTSLNVQQKGLLMYFIGGWLFTFSIIKKKPINKLQLSGCIFYNIGNFYYFNSYYSLNNLKHDIP